VAHVPLVSVYARCPLAVSAAWGSVHEYD